MTTRQARTCVHMHLMHRRLALLHSIAQAVQHPGLLTPFLQLQYYDPPIDGTIGIHGRYCCPSRQYVTEWILAPVQIKGSNPGPFLGSVSAKCSGGAVLPTVQYADDSGNSPCSDVGGKLGSVSCITAPGGRGFEIASAS